MNSTELTSLQLQSAYRIAVKSSLVAFFHKTDEQAEKLVENWWRRLSPIADVQSDMFLHDEAISTAADLASVREIPRSDAVRRRYRQIIQESTESALRGKRHTVARSVHQEAVKQRAG